MRQDFGALSLPEVARVAIGLVFLDAELDVPVRRIGATVGRRLAAFMKKPLSLAEALKCLEDACMEGNFVKCGTRITMPDGQIAVRFEDCEQALGYCVEEVGRSVCGFDAGFIEAFVQSLTQDSSVSVTETACLGLGDAHCEFAIERGALH